jgi:hypothetical protein
MLSAATRQRRSQASTRELPQQARPIMQFLERKTGFSDQEL